MSQITEDPGSLSIQEYLEQWLSHVKSRVRIGTRQGYARLIRLHATPHIGEVPLEALSPLALQRLYASLLERKPPLSGGTVLNLHLVLTHALGQAVRWRLLPSNPAAGAQPPRPKRPDLTVVDATLAARLLRPPAARGWSFRRRLRSRAG